MADDDIVWDDDIQWDEPKPKTGWRGNVDTVSRLMLPEPLRAIGETALAAGSGFGGMVLGGIGGLGRTLMSGPEEGARTSQRISNALTYEPDSPSARKVLETVGGVVDKYWSEPNRRAGGMITDVTGSPSLGAQYVGAMEAGPNVFGLPKVAAVRNAARGAALEAVPKTAPILTPEQVATRARALELGYELTPGQQTGKKWQTNFEAAMRDNPATAGRMQQMQAQNQALTNRLLAQAETMSGGNIDQGTAGTSALRAMSEGAEREAGKTGVGYRDLLTDVDVNLEAQRAKLEAIRKDQQRLPPEQQGGRGMVELETLLGDAGYVAPTRKGFAKPAVDIHTDDVVAAVRKLGGISAGDEAVGSLAKLYPFSPDPRLGPVWAKPKYATSTATNTVGGHSLDRMAQKLHELGYIDEVDPNLVMQALQDASTGVRGQKFSIFRDPPSADPLANAVEALTKQLGAKDAPPAPRAGYIRENPVISGSTAQDLRSGYGSSAEAAFAKGGKIQEGEVYGRMKSAIDDAIVTALPEEKSAQFASLNEKYGLDMAVKAMKPESQQTFLEQLYRGAPDQFYTFLGLADPQSFSDVARGFISRIVEQATDSRTGNIDAALLGRIVEKYAKAPDVKGAADVGKYLGGDAMPLLRDVGRIGTDVLPDKLGQSGTTPRAIYSNLLSGGIGGLAGGSVGSVPGAVAGVMLGQYLIPKGLQSLYLSDMMRGRLTGTGSGGPSLGSRLVRGLERPGVIAGLEAMSERRRELLEQLLAEGATQ